MLSCATQLMFLTSVPPAWKPYLFFSARKGGTRLDVCTLCVRQLAGGHGPAESTWRMEGNISGMRNEPGNEKKME